MLGSTNDFFTKQSYQVLSDFKIKVRQYLILKNRSESSIIKYLDAYDFFMINGFLFDGATIVKDLVDLRNGKYYLDLDAMLHDYEYIMGANLNYINKWKADFNYIKNMEKNGKGIRVFRLLALTVLGSYLPIVKYFE